MQRISTLKQRKANNISVKQPTYVRNIDFAAILVLSDKYYSR